MKSVICKNLWWSIAYWGTTLLFFLKDSISCFTNISYLVGIPILLAAIILFRIKGRSEIGIVSALLFSCGGDLCGVAGNVSLQMIFFTLAHVCYIVTFLSRAQFSLMGIACSIVLIASVQIYIFCITFGRFVENDYASILYALVVSTMCASTILYSGSFKVLFLIAAALFVLSDSMIAWGMYVGSFPFKTFLLMIVYYIAQYLFAYGAINRKGTNHLMVPKSVMSIN